MPPWPTKNKNYWRSEPADAALTWRSTVDNDPNDNDPDDLAEGAQPDDHGLPHWTEPGTGELPRIGAEAATTTWLRGPR